MKTLVVLSMLFAVSAIYIACCETEYITYESISVDTHKDTSFYNGYYFTVRASTASTLAVSPMISRGYADYLGCHTQFENNNPIVGVAVYDLLDSKKDITTLLHGEDAQHTNLEKYFTDDYQANKLGLFKLYFNEPYPEKKHYQFYIEVTLEDGTVLEATAPVVYLYPKVTIYAD